MRSFPLIVLLWGSFSSQSTLGYPASPPANETNVHHWDRKRRCDEGFQTPCGPCEGVGGIVWGDANDEIAITSCQVIEKTNMSEEVLPPVWGKSFQYQKGVHEILIGEKNDPLCFQAFPGPSPDAKFCYKQQEGAMYYDMEKTQALQLDLKIKLLGMPKPIQSTVIHHKTDFWVANTYWGGIKQCICVGFKHLYPIAEHWVDQGKYIGREKIMVEYLWEEMVLDHWIAGPHHFWTNTLSGLVVRMWQPWNGLEILDPKFRQRLTTDISFPPPMCKKGGALFRINCNDEGYPATCNAAECGWYDSEETSSTKRSSSFRSVRDLSTEAMHHISSLPRANPFH